MALLCDVNGVNRGTLADYGTECIIVILAGG